MKRDVKDALEQSLNEGELYFEDIHSLLFHLVSCFLWATGIRFIHVCSKLSICILGMTKGALTVALHSPSGPPNEPMKAGQ
jgi:hypothetical protein